MITCISLIWSTWVENVPWLWAAQTWTLIIKKTKQSEQCLSKNLRTNYIKDCETRWQVNKSITRASLMNFMEVNPYKKLLESGKVKLYLTNHPKSCRKKKHIPPHVLQRYHHPTIPNEIRPVKDRLPEFHLARILPKILHVEIVVLEIC